jgi:Saxitoxin biosynthesis operon protein SxtJ
VSIRFSHEAPGQTHEIKLGSDRGFGTVFTVVFALIAIWPAVRLGWWPTLDIGLVRWWSLALAACFCAATLIYPSVLHPLNRLWFRFGMLLSQVMTPIVMGLLFVLAVVPTALVMRLRGHDSMRLKLDRKAASYWIMREPPGPAPGTMKKQY